MRTGPPGTVDAAVLELRWDPATPSVTITGPAQARRFATLLAAAAADPLQPVSRLPLLDAAEEADVLARGMGPAPVGDHGAVPAAVQQLFEAQADRTPDRPAVARGADVLTYRELDEAANQLAHALGGRGVVPGEVVGVCVERGPSLLVAILGVLKAGAAYLPLHSDHPAARLARQLEETRARIVVTEKVMLDHLPAGVGERLVLDAHEVATDHADDGAGASGVGGAGGPGPLADQPTTRPAITVDARLARLRPLHVGVDGRAQGRGGDPRQPGELHP